jgi:hypothetical protein
MWRKAYNIEWAMDHDCLCIKASNSGKTYVLPPFGSEAALSRALDALIAYFHSQGDVFLMKAVPIWMKEKMEELKPDVFVFREDRDNFDYVYTVEDLSELKGRKYSRKRNHIKGFIQENSNYVYQALTEDLVQDCIDNELTWCAKRNCDEDPGLRCEKYAIIEALQQITYLGLTGGVILINGRVEAFTFGERLNEDTAVIHVEKGNPDIKGIYAVINQEFCRRNWQSFRYINREEDMGLEGLRKAKESYYPAYMVEKFDAILR